MVDSWRALPAASRLHAGKECNLPANSNEPRSQCSCLARCEKPRARLLQGRRADLTKVVNGWANLPEKVRGRSRKHQKELLDGSCALGSMVPHTLSLPFSHLFHAHTIQSKSHGSEKEFLPIGLKSERAFPSKLKHSSACAALPRDTVQASGFNPCRCATCPHAYTFTEIPLAALLV